MFLSHLPKNWECIFTVLRIDEVCLVWLEAVPAECIRLIRPTIFSEQIFSVLCHWKCVPVIHDRKIKYVQENILGREFQESHENFSATFKRKAAGIESLEDLKIKILREFEVL